MRRRIGFRWIRNGRRPAPDKSADRDADAARNGGAPEPEPDLDRLDPFAGGSSLVPDPTLTVAERREAEEEARHGVPTPEALAPSPGERRVESRFLAAMAAIRSRADASLGQLEAALRRARTRIPGLEGEAAAERKRLGSLAGAAPVCHRIETRYRRAETAARELAGFRRRLGLPDYASPRPSSRSWAWLLIGVAAAETAANGVLLHSASTEGVVANWAFAALVTAMNVGLLGWLVGDLIFRRMLGAGPGRRAALSLALVPCLGIASLLHFGFAHYRDAVQTLDGARAAAVADLDDIDAGAEAAGSVPDPHPPPPLTVEQAVFNELRAQFLWWRPGASFTDHPADLPPEDHSLDQVRSVPAGNVGYGTEGGSLVLREDPLAGRFEGWRSVLLLAVGFVALLLAAWKWYGGREPIPHFARLHRRKEEADRALEAEVTSAFAWARREERLHGERLAGAETGLAALSARMTAIHGLMRKIALREEDLLHRTAAAAESAIEDFREANRRQRLSRDPPPAFWRRLSRPVPSERDGDQPGRWDQLHGQAVAEAAEAGGRVRLANLAHAPEAAAVFDDVRERIAQAARLPAGRRRNPPAPEGGDPSGPEGEGVHLVRRGRAYPRIEAAS